MTRPPILGAWAIALAAVGVSVAHWSPSETSASRAAGTVHPPPTRTPTPTPHEPSGGATSFAPTPRAVDLGEIQPGSTVSAEFRLHNRGDHSVTVRSIYSHCRCTVIAARSARIEPGDHLDVQFGFTPKGGSDVERSTVFIETDDPEVGTLSVPVVATVTGPKVIPELRYAPSAFDLDPRDVEAPVDLRLDNPSHEPRRVTLLHAGKPIAERLVPPRSTRRVALPIPGTFDERGFSWELRVDGEPRASIPLRLSERHATLQDERHESRRGGLSIAPCDPEAPLPRLRFGLQTVPTHRMITVHECAGRARTVRNLRQLTASRAFSVSHENGDLDAHGALTLQATFDPSAGRGSHRSLWSLQFEDGTQIRFTLDGYAPAAAVHHTDPCTILVAANHRGALEPCGCAGRSEGGLARLAAAIRSAPERRLALHTGRLIDPAHPAGPRAVDVALRSLALAGCDVLVAAAPELSLGAETIARLAQDTGVTIIGTNTVDLRSQSAALPTYAIRSVGETSVGILGLVPMRDVADERIAAAELDLASERDAVKQALEQLEGRVDALVLAGPIDLELGRKLAGFHPTLDLILLGAEASPTCVQVGATWLLSAPTAGHSLTRVQCGQLGGTLSIDEHTTTVLDEAIVPATDVHALMSRYQQELKTLARSPRTAEPHFVGSARCTTCHEDAASHHATSAHAHAYDTLVRSGRPYDPTCLQCHTVGFDRGTGFRDLNEDAHLAEVGCESCHGPGGEHVERGLAMGPAKACAVCHTPHESPTFQRDEYARRLGHGTR